jgi:hypothetical protein
MKGKNKNKAYEVITNKIVEVESFDKQIMKA